ncbi:hypothetical protein ACFYU8_31045 [Brevibacillus sp. NPDC003359]|uniref:hypothetical protein n=1 Tax=unclassified Brevibacillus TaxID=2684853 RepID=UPI0036B6C44B
MIITCDAYCNMGYIYLQQPGKEIVDSQREKDNKISRYVDPSLLHIPLVVDLNRGKLLDDMQLSAKTYKMAIGDEIDEEYQNDLDEQGYMTGIELNLSRDRLVHLLENKAFVVYRTEWKGKPFHLATLDIDHKVFDSSNVIYPLNEKQDAFVIIEVKGEYQIGLVKALLTRRDDLYPVEYLLAPQFILSEYTL